MARYDLTGTHVLNKYIWSELEREFGLKKSDYKGLVPIVPTQQIPVLNDLPSGNPFIIYTYYNAGYDVDFWADIEQFQYRIYSDQEQQLRRISNFLADLLKRWDWTADQVNSFVSTLADNADEKKFDIKYVNILSAVSPEPTETEDGRQSAVITGRICYTHDSEPDYNSRTGMRI